jgi:hypothetical protein
MDPAHVGSRQKRRSIFRTLVVGIGIIVAAVLVVNVLGEVALLYSGGTTIAGARSPLRFTDGGDYASASAEGMVMVTFPTTQQVGFTAAVKGANGAYGTYLLDMVEVEALTNTSTGWHAHLAVVSPIVGTGINAAYVFACTTAPTAVPDSGAALASGTDAAGDVWAIYAPSCLGTQSSSSLLISGTGSTIALPGLVYGSSILFLSFAVAVSSAGASTTAAATVVLSTSSP